MEKDNIKGCFVSSVLLSQNQWDKKQFIHDFEEDWGIVLTDDDDNGDVLVGMFSGMTLAIASCPVPYPTEKRNTMHRATTCGKMQQKWHDNTRLISSYP